MRIFITLTFLLCTVYAIHAQEVSPVGVIPDWVKEKTTPEEYKVWETLSQYYQIDYSGLKERNLKGERKEQEYARLRTFCDALRSGKVKPQKGEKFIFPYGGYSSMSAYSTKEMKCVEKKYIIYSSKDGYDAHVELTVLFEVTPQSEYSRIISHSIKGISFSGLKTDLKEAIYENKYQKFGFRINFDSKSREVWGYYPGTLSFTDPEGKEHTEEISVNFCCPAK